MRTSTGTTVRLADVMAALSLATDLFDAFTAREYNAPFLKAFSDLHFRYTSSVTSGKRTVTTLSATGTHDGPLVTPAGVIPATGRKIALDAVLIVTVNGGKIVKEETYWDRIEMMEQLGVAPA